MPIPVVSLDVDFGAADGRIRPLHGVNSGPLQVNGWLNFSKMYKELGIPSARLHDCPWTFPETVDIHCLFPDFAADEMDPKNYRFAVTDDYIQATIDTGAKIVFRLGESIEHHAKRKYHVHPPADYQKWARICVQVIKHYNAGWADGFQHDIRYWEIWNEPYQASCWMGTREDYYRLYDVAARAIKAYDPTLKVGGPTSGDGPGPDTFGEDFLKYQQARGTPLDFYSWHMYTIDPIQITEAAADIKRLLVKYGYEKAESHFNEWSYLPSEGWDFNLAKKDPEVIRRAWEEIGGATGAAFDASTLMLMQDCPIDVANYYTAWAGFWGLVDECGKPRKNFYAFKAFRGMLDTPVRAKCTVNDAATGYSLMAGKAEDGSKASMMLANFRGRAAHYKLRVANWPWEGKAVCKVYLIDYDRTFSLVAEKHLVAGRNVLELCIPAPSVAYVTVERG
jgi:xylan 1,4-beta-xylosidase